MSGQSFNYYMRPQDRDDGNRNNHAGGRGRSQHLDLAHSRSRGRSRGRSYDFYDGRNNDYRGMRYDARSDQHHRSRISDYAPRSWSHRSRSCDPHSSRQTSYSSSHHSFQRNSSHSRKRSRSPEPRNHDAKINDNDRYERSSRPRSFGNGRPNDVKSYDNERYPLALASSNGAVMHRPPANEYHQKENSANYTDKSSSSRMSNMNMINSYSYYNPQSRYRHEQSNDISYERRPLERQGVSTYPALQQRKSTPSFHNNDTIPTLIQIAYDNLAILKPSTTAAFWNKVLKQLEANKQSSPYYGQMNSHLNQVFEHTRNTLSLFSKKDLCQTIYSMAKLVDVICKNCGRRSGCGEDIVDLLSSRLLTADKTPKKELFLSLACAFRDKLDYFDARHLSNVAYAYALIKYVPEFDDGSDLFDHIVTQATRRGTEFNAQDISNIVWAYATVEMPHPRLFEAIGDKVAAHEHLGDFKPQALSNTVWAFAKAGIYYPKLFEKVASHAVRLDVLYGFKPQHLSNTLWAYATAGINHPTLFERVANHIVKFDLNGFNPQSLSNTVWAYATAGTNHPKLFETVANFIVESKHLDRFNPQHLSNTVWAYATAGINHPQLFETVANHIVQSDILKRFNPQDLSNTVWAYATAGINHPKMFEAVANHMIESKHLHRFNPQDLSNTVWAYATASIPHPRLFETVANQIVESDILNQFKPQELSNTVWAYATSQVSHPNLFEEVAKAAIQRKEKLSSQAIANLLWSYATMGIIEKQLFLSFESTAAELDDSYTKQDLANVAWAYAVADVDAPTLFNDHFISKCVEENVGFEAIDFSQLHQWHLWQTKEKSKPGLPIHLQERCYKAFVSRDPLVSELQQNVVAQLSSIGLEPKEESLMDSGYRIDAIVEVNGKKVGIEVDGPSHFIGRSENLLAKTILKRRQVPSIDGIELLSVPYWEWDHLSKDEVKTREYLRLLLGFQS